MISRFSRFFCCSLLLPLTLIVAVPPARADASHARIVRLSLVQGEVRFARDVKGDPLTDEKTIWDNAIQNLPIRQGYVIATDNGRATVEFENGAMAFLGQNTVVEFYDLSLEDGGKTTRLVLRQGTASFDVNPGNTDYFSVTGGDFTAEAVDRTHFRLDNFEDGSVVDVTKGHVNVLRKNDKTLVAGGQSLSMRAGDAKSASIGAVSPGDDFDRWVNQQIETTSTATAAAGQYVSSPYYASGFGDLYTYGSWYSMAGYGNCWRPYGVGLGWSPFDSGGWFADPMMGMSFIGSQPWGWLPYHFGSWLFDPMMGWMWAPTGFGMMGYGYGYGYGGYGYGGYGYGGYGFGGYMPWQPFTGHFVQGHNGLIGIVPTHPLDAKGKAPVNMARGVFPISGGAVSRTAIPVGSASNWKIAKSVPSGALSSSMVASSAPERVYRTMAANGTAARSFSRVAYDPTSQRFVSTRMAAPPGRLGAAAAATGLSAVNRSYFGNNGNRGNVSGVPRATNMTARAGEPPRPSRAMAPAPARGGFNGSRGGGFSRGGYGGSRGGGFSSMGSPGGMSHGASAPSGGGGHPR